MHSSLSPREAAIAAAILASRIDLLAFVRLTKQDYVIAPHHELIAKNLMAVARGDIKRLMLFLPPRHGKSQLSSRHFPAWYLGKFPNKQIILASYSGDLAKAFGRDVRNLVADPLYTEIFPGTQLQADSKSVGLWHTQAGGIFLSAGFGGAVTGFGADLLLIDDPFKDPEEAQSKVIKDKRWEQYKQALYTRLMPGGAIIMTLTRWAEDDVAGRAEELAKETGEDWTIVKIPAIAMEEDPLGRQPGEALWPDRYPLHTLETIKTTLGATAWNALYQQEPMTETGNIIKKDWWQYYTIVPDSKEVFQSWDTAFKTGQDNDPSVCITCMVHKGHFYLIDVFRARLEFPDLERAMLSMANKHRPQAILVEDKASGQSIAQVLRRTTKLPIIPVRVDVDKVARVRSVTPLIEGGRILLPEYASWVPEYVDELRQVRQGQA